MMTGRTTLAVAPGRICIAGENLDWMVGPVMTAALRDLVIQVSVKSRADELVTVRYGSWLNKTERFPLGYRCSNVQYSVPYLPAVISTLREAGVDLVGMDIDVRATLPLFGGLASSGALCVALVGAIATHLRFALKREEIASLAYQAERKVVSCGQMDQYACALGGLLYMDCSRTPPAVTSFSAIRGVSFVMASVGQAMPFAEVYDELKVRWREREERIVRYVEQTQQRMGQIKEAIVMEDAEALGHLVDSCHSLITHDLGIQNPDLEKYVEVARATGALGAKSSGIRRRGGTMFALVRKENVEMVRHALANAGAQTYVSELAMSGVRIERG